MKEQPRKGRFSNGNVKIDSLRNGTMCIDFFDHEWIHQPFHEPKDYPFADIEPRKPCCFEQMWDMAKRLAKNKSFSRVDFYQVNGQVFFGEITFFPTSGMGGFSPEEYDMLFGTLLKLPL